MRNQNAELGKRLKSAIDYVAIKKGTQWAKETEAEMKASERFLTAMMAYDINDSSVTEASLGKLSGYLVPPELTYYGGESVFFPNKKRITPHDTGNLIEAISMTYKKYGKEYEFSVGVDYTKLNRSRYLYSWLFNRHGQPGVYVKRPGSKKSGAYVQAANKNSDENPQFLSVWGERGLANVKRIFR